MGCTLALLPLTAKCPGGLAKGVAGHPGLPGLHNHAMAQRRPV